MVTQGPGLRPKDPGKPKNQTKPKYLCFWLVPWSSRLEPCTLYFGSFPLCLIKALKLNVSFRNQQLYMLIFASQKNSWRLR
jgi:hypothetical protein